MRIFTRNFVRTKRGCSSAVLVEANDTLLIGTVFFSEVGGTRVNTASGAAAWCETNQMRIAEALLDDDDGGIVPGWSRSPVVEQSMIERARDEAGW